MRKRHGVWQPQLRSRSARRADDAGNRLRRLGVLMGMGSTHIDSDAVRSVARRYGSAADLLDGAVRSHLSELRFTGSTAGRAYRAEGDELHTALVRLAIGVEQWSRSSAEIAAVLHVDSDRQVQADRESAELIA